MNISRLLGVKDDGARAIEAYDLGLAAKYEGRWEESLRQNQIADRLRPGDEATLWNLAIAATALSDWEEARRAWLAFGINVINDGPGEVIAGCGRACVRLDPQGQGEVVWGERIDPARIRILNVPLAESGRRYGDVLINDGAPEGHRISGGEEYPVFNELGMWKVSAHSTYEVELVMPNDTAMESLEAMCRENDMWVENWGTIRHLCAACSRGNPGEHVCSSEAPDGARFGFAARSESALRLVLAKWAEMEAGVELGGVKLVVGGVNT